jgi:hypothetical protein
VKARWQSRDAVWQTAVLRVSIGAVVQYETAQRIA